MTTDRAQQDLGESIKLLDSLTLYLPTCFHSCVAGDVRRAVEAVREIGYTIERLERRFCPKCNGWVNQVAHLACQDEERDLALDSPEHEEWMEAERRLHHLGG